MNRKFYILLCMALLAWASPLLAGEAERSVDRLRSRFSTHATERFMVMYATSDAWAAEVGTLLEQTHDQFYACLGGAGFDLMRPDGRLVCLWFASREAFDRYAWSVDRADMSWSDGYYSAKTNRVALFHQAAGGDYAGDHADSKLVSAAHVAPQRSDHEKNRRGRGRRIDVAKTTHEAAHQLAFNSGLQRRGVIYPLWASEGLATNFEADAAGRMGPCADNTVRRHRLVTARERGKLLPLEQLITLTDVSIDPPRAPRVLYAEAWGFFRFLFQERPESLAAYYEALAKLNEGWRPAHVLRREFVEAFGPIAPLRQDWEQFLAELAGDEKGTS